MHYIEWLIHYMITNLQIKIIGKAVSYDSLTNLRIRYLEKYAKHEISSADETNQAMIKWIKSGKPFAATRNGMGETAFFIKMTQDKVLHTNQAKQQRMAINFNCDKEEMERYYQLVKEAYHEADITAIWGNVPMEEHCIAKCRKEAIVSPGAIFHLYDYKGCWLQELAGKKVLIVSPFVDIMRDQYLKREHLHKYKDTLPEFELHTVKSIWWYSGGRDERFQSWFDVLDYLFDQCMAQEFDIALLSCSTWSTPLAVRLKQANKQAVQLGGTLQLLFGIKGKRWDNYDDLYNEYWVRLPEETKSGNVDVLDNTKGGAYW